MTDIRLLTEADFEAWKPLWQAYLVFYKTSRTDAYIEFAFRRMLDPVSAISGIVAEDQGQLTGLCHFIRHAHGWHAADVCYLQDLYTDPSVRGQGTGRRLIEDVYRRADAEGLAAVYWLTQEANYDGRRLYDKVGRKTDFIKYDR